MVLAVASVLSEVAGILATMYGNLDVGLPERMRRKTYGGFFGKFFFLTHILLAFTTLVLTIGLAINVTLLWLRHNKPKHSGSSFAKSLNERLVDVYRNVLPVATTLEFLVTCLFWPLFRVKKELVVNPEFYTGKDSVTLFFNLCMHGFPFLFLFIEFMIHPFTPLRSHYVLFAAFALAYAAVIFTFNQLTGKWPYKILAVFTGFYRVAFFVACLLILVALYHVLGKVHRTFSLAWNRVDGSAEKKPPLGKARARGRRRSQSTPG